MANTNAGGKFYVCATPQPNNLTQEQFEALVWVEVTGVGSKPESGTATNIVSYDTLNTDVTEKGKGISNAGDGTLEVARNPTDPGQVIMRAAALTKYNYATKFAADDAPSAGYIGSIFYNRGLIAGPVHPAGRNEDFILEVFTIGHNQREIVVNPAALSAPANTVLPSIAYNGAAYVANEGSWSNDPTSFAYLWEEDDTGWVAITGGTGKTLAYGGANNIRVTVTPTNGAGAGTPATSLAVVPD